MKKTVFLTVFLAVLIGFGCFSTAPVKAEENDYGEKPDEFYTYVQKFTDLDSVNNAFHAYYLEKALGSSKTEAVVADANDTENHWAITDGVLKRINDVKKDSNSGNYETNQIAVLTYAKETFLNFELSVDVKRGPSGFWPVIGIRQIEEGKYYLDDGAGVFVQENGMITLWGDAVVTGPYEFATVDGWKMHEWHNLQIRVLGNELMVSVDHAPWVTQALKEEFYDEGYVSLCSTNNLSEFRNFRIKALAEPEAPEVKTFAPVKEANTDDSLSKLAGEVKSKESLFEREPEGSSSNNGNGSNGGSGCGKTAAAIPAAVLPLIALAFVRGRKN